MAENVMRKGITMMIMMLMIMLVVTQVCEATQSSIDCDQCRTVCGKQCGPPTEPLLICYRYCLHVNCPDCPCLICYDEPLLEEND